MNTDGPPSVRVHTVKQGLRCCQSSWKRMCLCASLARAMMIFSALDMSWSVTRDGTLDVHLINVISSCCVRQCGYEVYSKQSTKQNSLLFTYSKQNNWSIIDCCAQKHVCSCIFLMKYLKCELTFSVPRFFSLGRFSLTWRSTRIFCQYLCSWSPLKGIK